MSSATSLGDRSILPHAVLSQRNRDGALPAPGEWNAAQETDRKSRLAELSGQQQFIRDALRNLGFEPR